MVKTNNNSFNYLSYMLNKEVFAIDVKYILEVIDFPTITYVPNSSPFIQGVINFRGEIIPVIDMHKRFMKEPAQNKYKIIIIIKLDTEELIMHLGLLVDNVNGVITFATKDIQNIPDNGLKYNKEFLDGLVNINQDFIMLLNIDKTLNPKELAR